MIENKQQTALEWYDNEIEKLFNQFTIDKINIYEFRTKRFKLLEQAKEMEKQQTRDDIKNELKLIGNYFDVGKLDQREQGHHIRFTSILKDRFDFYNETNGGNK